MDDSLSKIRHTVLYNKASYNKQTEDNEDDNEDEY